MSRAAHPEAEAGEVWIGNMFRSDFAAVGWLSKRRGVVAYFMSGKNKGKPIPKAQRFCPVFVSRAEIEQAGVAIPDNGVIDHRW